MSSLLSAELIAACNSIGHFDAKCGKYYADKNTLETVKDLIRYLRRDVDSHDIRRQLGESDVLRTDLVPLLKGYWEQNDLFDVLLRLIVNLTTPALILYNEDIPLDKTVRNYYIQIEEHLQKYKEAFADDQIWAVLCTKLSRILEMDYAERGDENSLVIERILILIRNVLYVPADTAEKRPDNDASIHDQVLWALHQSGMLDIILYMSSSVNEKAYFMHILEFLPFMMRDQKPSELADAQLQRSQTEKLRDEEELKLIRFKENYNKTKKMRKYTGARHSRFGGTYVVTSLKSIGDNDLIYHKPLNKIDELNFDTDKSKPKTPKNRTPFTCNSKDRRSAFAIRLFLKQFCVEFLKGAYNTLMHHARNCLVRAKVQDHDESYYLWSLRFFMEFNRCYEFEVELVSETISVQTFHFVQQQSETYYDLIQTDKKRVRSWSRRLHNALLAYRELFRTLDAMDKSTDENVRESSKIIKSNIFYVPEYREFILTLLISYDELKMSDVYLVDLIETQHVFLKMFESFCGGQDGAVVVKKRVRRGRGKGRKNKINQISQDATPAINLEEMWDEAGPQISTLLQEKTNFSSDVVPFDAASEIPIDEQKSEAMKKVQKMLRSFDFENAIALLRSSREVWPENDCFGSDKMSVEEEFLAVREIFFADLGEDNNPVIANRSQNEVQEENDDHEEEEEEEEEDNGPQFKETDLNFKDFLMRLPHPKIVRACALALKQFETNSTTTNYSILKLLHRIAFDCKMSGMVFQLSIFRTFQRIFASKDLPQFKELVKFATYIMREFFKVAEKNNLVYVESLFWKSKRDAYDIENGYGSFQKTSKVNVWSEHEEDELRRLFMEHQNNKIEEDVVDWIQRNMIDNSKSRRAVLKKLKEMHLIVHYGGRKKSSSAVWGVEEEEQLRELYEEFRDAADPLSCIMPRLDVPKPRNRIVEKLLVLGLIQDKSEVRKKRQTATKKSKPREISSPSFDSSDSDDSNVISNRNVVQQRNVQRTKTGKNLQKRTKDYVPADKGDLTRILIKNIEEGRNEALNWLKESISDAIEDIQEGSQEGIPLIPIMEYAWTAMEHDDFKKLLKLCGICEPFDEQEMYWRIPWNIPINVLQEHCVLIQGALDGELMDEDVEGVTGGGSEEVSQNVEEEMRSDEGAKNEEIAKKCSKIIDSDSEDDGLNDDGNNWKKRSSSSSPSMGVSDTERSASKKRRVIVDDSDED